MSNIKVHIIKCILGSLMVITGILLAIFYTVPQEVMEAFPPILIGSGIVFLIGGVSGIITARMMKKDSGMAKQVEIHENDERNILIGHKARTKTDDFITPLYLAFLIFLAVMEVQLLVILVFASILLLRTVLLIYLMRRYQKKM